MTVAPISTETWSRSLAAVATGSAVPYGYTVTLWSSGAVLSHAHGAPDILRIALFMVGALAGFTAFGGVARVLGDSDEEIDGDHKVVAGMSNWIAVACAVGMAWVCSHLPSAPSWGLGSAVAPMVYLTLVVVEIAAAKSRLQT